MFRSYIYIHTTRFVMFLLAFLFYLLTASAFAWWPGLPIGWLAMDIHQAEDLDVVAHVTIDDLRYEPSGAGVVYLDGSFSVYNRDPVRGVSYDGELRLEIFDKDGNTYQPDAKNRVGGVLRNNGENVDLGDVYDNFSESVNLHIDCLDPSGDGKPIQVDGDYIMSASITMTVYGFHQEETWTISNPDFQLEFTHNPEGIQGLGPTTDGETFSDNCYGVGGEAWQSLVITDTPYSIVYWYIHDEEGSLVYFECDFGDRAKKKTTMTYTFPADVGGQFEEGAYYNVSSEKDLGF